MKPHACVTSPLPGEANCSSFLTSRFRGERKRNGEREWRGNINRNKGSALALCFSNVFLAEPYLREPPVVPACLDPLLQPSTACPKAAVGCSPAPSRCPPAPRPCPPNHSLFFQRCRDGENKLSDINTPALASPMVPLRGAAAESLALASRRFRSCLWDSLSLLLCLILSSET